MRPEEVIDLGQSLVAAIDNGAEEAAARTAVDILLGVAFNIALLAHPEKEPE